MDQSEEFYVTEQGLADMKKELDYLKTEKRPKVIAALNNEGIKDMILIVKKQEDTRYAPNIRHKMEDIILIVLFAILAKCNEWTEIESFAKKKEKWLKKHLELPNGIPSHDTIQRVISLLDPNSLYADTINYLIEKINTLSSSNERDILSMDGKTSNGSKRSTGKNKEEPSCKYDECIFNELWD